MNRQRILLIGGGGYLGSRLAPRLSAAGHEVEILVRDHGRPTPAGFTVHIGGLGNVALLRRILPSFDTVFHLASGTTPGVSGRDPSLEAERQQPRDDLCPLWMSSVRTKPSTFCNRVRS